MARETNGRGPARPGPRKPEDRGLPASAPLVWWTGIMLALIGCGEEPRVAGTVVRDSAGIVLIEHGEVAEAPGEWSVSAVPLLTVGTVSGAPEYELDRIMDVRRLGDGSIVVLDASRTLRSYDAQGVHVWTAGGRGDGPGEFSAPYLVREIPPDSLVVWDARPNRLSVFTSDGAFVRSSRVEGITGNGVAVGLTGPRSLLLEVRRLERTTIEGHPALVHPSDFYVVDLEGVVVREFGRRLHSIDFQEVDEGGGYSPAVFATSAVFAPSGGGLWYGDTGAYELREGSEPDRPRRIVRWEGPDRTVTDADVEGLLDTWAQEGGDDEELLRFLEAYGDTHPRAAAFPAYERLLVDRSERLWVRDYVREHEDDGVRRWTVFSSDGDEVLGRVTHDASLELHDIGEDWVLVVATDSLDVESVQVRRILVEG